MTAHTVFPIKDSVPRAEDLALIRAPGKNRGPARAAWEKACADLLIAWEPTVRVMARRYAPMSSHRPDFAQVARLALIRSALKFKEGAGRHFEHYARRSLRNALVDESRRVRRNLREVSLEQFPALRKRYREECGAARMIRDETRGLIRSRVGLWEHRLQVLIDLLFVHDLSQSEAARRLGLTSARISQLCKIIRQEGRRQLSDCADLLG